MTEGIKNFGKKMCGKKMGISQQAGKKDLLRMAGVAERKQYADAN